MNPNSHLISSLLSDDRIKVLLDKQEKSYWDSSIGITRCDEESNSESLSKVTFLFTMLFFENLEEQDISERAYKLLKTFPIDDKTLRAEWNDLVNLQVNDEYLSYHFLLASVALLSNKTISARLSLSNYVESSIEESDWGKRVLAGTVRSLLYLIRKQYGFKDIRKAIDSISKLQQEQASFEYHHLNAFNAIRQTEEALQLVALYHTSKAVVETAQYILQGYSYPGRKIDTIVRQHIDIARKLTQTERFKSILNIIETDLYRLISNSIWTGTAFQEKVKLLCKKKGELGMLELLPSQRDAMSKNLLDVAANAIVLQMPTSAGKTLLAEFNIVVTKSLLPQSKVVYIVPSRALVNQVCHDLRVDLSSLGFSVEKTSSVNEVDPSEDAFLQAGEIDVLISTPEKLDLLIRRNHPSVQDVSMFIVDEAHTIRNGARGARLELLIAILRREHPNAKYMFLSPFLPGDKTSIQDWLGGGNTIEVNWKPSEKVVFGVKVTEKKVKTQMIPSPYAASYQQEYTSERPIDVPLQTKADKERILEYTCKHFAERDKTQLILCQGRTSANNMAKEIFDWVDAPDSPDAEIQLVQKYLEEEMGCATLFSQLLSKRIAIHHAGLSDETKLLIEHLIREKQIQYVCATTTVAEGVNFPVSSVYFDSYYRGQAKKENVLSSNDFWNIAGRAGRTMVDDFGRIILPFNSKQNKELGLSIVNKSTEEMASVLARLFDDRQRIIATLEANDYSLSQLSYEYADSFAPLFQYFIHLLHVSKNEYVQDVEDLFKDTFIYSKLSLTEQADFIDLCKKIYQTIEAKYSSQTGLLSFADKTGFSVPSVLKIMTEQSKRRNIANIDSWNPDILFSRNDSSNLAEKIDVIATLPETGLGTDSRKAPFNPEIVAKVLIAWVHGDKLDRISSIHPNFKNDDITNQITGFVNYMNSARFKASWGLSALEGIVKGVNAEVKDSYVPSFVYYGVDDKKALALRMIGIPRSLSSSLSQVITDNLSNYSFVKLRKTINDLPLRDWDALSPTNSKLSGEEWKRIVCILMEGK
ncbi:MAG: DEAD/DEAH box helicase [Prevotella sp.]|nr:DEAD/DEAH box helicase [Prevotella sp.]